MRIVIDDNNSLYVEGYSNIIKVCCNQINILYNRKIVIISGNNIKIVYLNGNELLIKGIIDNISFK